MTNTPQFGRWTSVDEQLPSAYSDCILYSEPATEYYYGLYHDGKWEANDEFHTDITQTITHWMPMPLPPSDQPRLFTEEEVISIVGKHLEKAADNATVSPLKGKGFIDFGKTMVDRESITNTKIEL